MYAFKIVISTVIVLMLLFLGISGAKVAVTKKQIGVFLVFIITYCAALVGMWF